MVKPRPSYREVVQNLEARGVMPDRPPSLEPMKQALAILKEKLNLQIPREQVIIIAGTNGKGTTSATLEALFLDAGEKVGLYTSPHLEETTERIRLQGNDLTQDLFVDAFLKVEPWTRDLGLSHFEMLTLMAAVAFHAQTTIQIFEVGLGGLWDATNAIPHQTSVLTMIDYDHQDMLGNTLREIARNKFGVIPKSDSQLVIHTRLAPEVAMALEEWKKECPAFRENQHRYIEAAQTDFEIKARPDHPLREPATWLTSPWGPARLSLPGRRSAENSLLALTTFAALGFSPREHLSALERVRWPGRMELFKTPALPCPIALSGDHNASGIQSLMELLPYYPRKKLHVLGGVGKRKDLKAVLDPLFELKKSAPVEIYLTETPFQGLSISQYGDYREKASWAGADPAEGLRKIQERALPEDLILVTGSLYLVGAVRKHLFRN